jgi:Trypsin-like peptidase domain
MRVSAVLAGVLAFTAGCGAATSPPEPQVSVSVPAPGRMAAAPVPPDPKVGALFLGAGDLHTCSAGVLDSKGGDLILTAAHCVAEDVDTTFVAGFADTADPADIWRVDAIYLDPRWVHNQDPLADFAVLRVARSGGGSVETEAGGGLTIGPAPEPGTEVTVTGYGLGVGGGPIGCKGATASAPEGFPTLPCGGLIGGTSGSPWTIGSTVTGLVGGLDGGGCDENVSYSPPFDNTVVALMARAEEGGPSDAAPSVFDDDC